MANRLGPLEIQCDAPPYAIVQACRTIGFHTPEDVRWCKRSHFQAERAYGRESITHKLWRIAGAPETDADTCTCGEKLPVMQGFTFTFTTGEETSYNLGQCSRCRTVFWDGIG